MNKFIAWEAFWVWAKGKDLKEIKQGYFNFDSTPPKGSTLLIFTDGSEALIKSDYEEDWSEVTPGDGLQPPIVEIVKEAPR